MTHIPGEPLRVAIAALRRRPMTVAELHEGLAAKGFLPAEVEETVAQLAGWGFLSDSRVAETILARRGGRKARGDLALREEMARHGLAEELIEEAISLMEEPDELLRAADLLAQRFPAGTEPARAARFLASRGFGEEAVEGAVSRLVIENEVSST